MFNPFTDTVPALFWYPALSDSGETSVPQSSRLITVRVSSPTSYFTWSLVGFAVRLGSIGITTLGRSWPYLSVCRRQRGPVI